jgi:hypothetical protein
MNGAAGWNIVDVRFDPHMFQAYLGNGTPLGDADRWNTPRVENLDR